MTDLELLVEVRRLRGIGASPKEIARALGVRPAVVAPLVRQLGAEARREPAGEPQLAGCWVSPGWSRELLVDAHEGWEDRDVGDDGPAGVAVVLVARALRGNRITVCSYLLDTFCLGVKNVIGPEPLRDHDLPALVRMHFGVFPGPALRAPLELARELVLGAAAFASTLGFDPHPDFVAARGHLGERELDGPRAITFGRAGQPLYVQGPFDDPIAIIETLRASRGDAGFAVAA